MSTVRLYLDADASAELATQSRARGIDVICARDASKLRASDPEHLAFAVSQQRALFTHNRDDFLELAIQYFEQDKEHPGIIIAPQYDLGQIVRRVMNLIAHESAQDLQNQIRFLQAYKPSFD